MKNKNSFFQPKFDDKGRMVAIILTAPVLIEGRDFFGRKAWLQFVPSYSYNPGWYLDTGGRCERFSSIYPKNIITRKRRLCLTKRSDQEEKILINHLEHITALRMLGLDAIGISCGSGTWPPFLMAGELWEWLTPHLRYGDYSLEWIDASPETSTGWCTSGRNRLTSVWGTKIVPGLGIDAHIRFGRELMANKRFFISAGVDRQELVKIFYAPTPGWPPKLYYLAKLAEWLGWPHNKRICWGDKCPTQNDPGEVWIRHRIVDILGSVGAMSIALGGKAIISTEIDSYAGGHESDLIALKKSFKREV